MTESSAAARESALGEDFRRLMARFPTGVAVVTTQHNGRPRGLTVSSVCSVTLTPPTLLVCLRSASPTLAAIESSGGFTVNLLHCQAQSVAELFASGAQDRFDRIDWTLPSGAQGPHLVRDAHAIADCGVSWIDQVGDHKVVFGSVLDVSQWHSHVPLIYGFREFQPWPSGVPQDPR